MLEGVLRGPVRHEPRHLGFLMTECAYRRPGRADCRGKAIRVAPLEMVATTVGGTVRTHAGDQ